MLSKEQLACFEQDGYLLLPSTLTAAELDDAEATWDRLTDGGKTSGMRVQYSYDPGFVRLVSHPFFEAVAKQLLRSAQVRLAELGPRS
eukprot:SAG31_NODE_25066_length_468_cov_1.392954_1_plen_87_part_10